MRAYGAVSVAMQSGPMDGVVESCDASLRLDAGRLDDGAPAEVFGGDVLGDLLRGIDPAFHARGRQDFLRGGRLDHLSDFRIEFCHDSRRSIGRGGDGVPGIDYKLRHARFGRGTHFLQARQAPRPDHGQALQLARLDQRNGRWRAGEREVDHAANQVRHDWRRALVGHRHDLDAGQLGQQRARQLARHGAIAEGQGIRLGLGQRDEFLQIGRAHVRTHYRQRRLVRDLRNEGEVLDWVEQLDLADPGIGDQGADEQQQRVAVRGRLGGDGRAHRSLAARPIVDEDLLAQAFGQSLSNNARHRVGTAARRKGHDQADRLGRVRLGLGVQGCNVREAERGGHCQNGFELHVA